MSEIPKPNSEIDFEPLKRCCQEYIDALNSEDPVDEDMEHYIFEEAIKCIYGKSVWKWINERLN